MAGRERGHSVSGEWCWEKYENFNPLTLSNTFFCKCAHISCPQNPLHTQAFYVERNRNIIHFRTLIKYWYAYE
jgi:hypothetical protein